MADAADVTGVRHIVAFGGLRVRPGARPPLVDYLLSLSGKPRPKVCFIPTATAEVVTSRAGATAYRVELRDGQVVETPLEARSIAPAQPG